MPGEWRSGLSRIPIFRTWGHFYHPVSRIELPITDPAGTWSGPGATAPTLADPGTYIPGMGRPLKRRRSRALLAITAWRARARRLLSGGHLERSRSERPDAGGPRAPIFPSPARRLLPRRSKTLQAPAVSRAPLPPTFRAARMLCPDSRGQQREAGRSWLLHAELGATAEILAAEAEPSRARSRGSL